MLYDRSVYQQIKIFCPLLRRNMSQPHPTVQQPQGLAVLLDKAQGCVLGLMCGDALGAAVEGFDRHEILKVAQEHCNGDAELRDFIPAVHMGSFVANPDPDLINAPPVPARSVTDVRFLPTGACGFSFLNGCPNSAILLRNLLASANQRP